jgi:hypothetical protein
VDGGVGAGVATGVAIDVAAGVATGVGLGVETADADDVEVGQLKLTKPPRFSKPVMVCFISVLLMTRNRASMRDTYSVRWVSTRSA